MDEVKRSTIYIIINYNNIILLILLVDSAQ